MNKSWLDVRRDLSDDQVRSIHELFTALWPVDTRLIELLPSPQSKRSRALFLGATDGRTVCALVVGMLAYVDEVVVVHPFVNANAMRSEFNPIKKPRQYRNQTLNNVFTILALAPFIEDGRVHLIPDPVDYDTGFRQEIMAISKRFEDEVSLGPIDMVFADALSKDELMCYIKRLPRQDMKAQLIKMAPEYSTEMTSADIDTVISYLKMELENDPLALLDPPPATGSGGELRVLKGFSRETGLFIATLTGAFVYTNSDTMWARLHHTDGVHSYVPDHASERTFDCLDGLRMQLTSTILANPAESSRTDSTRQLLRKISLALRTGEFIDTEAREIDETDPLQKGDDFRTFKLRLSVPVSGFQRVDVSRLVLTFGRLQEVAPVRLAIYLEPVQPTVQSSSDKLDNPGSAGCA